MVIFLTKQCYVSKSPPTPPTHCFLLYSLQLFLSYGIGDLELKLEFIPCIFTLCKFRTGELFSSCSLVLFVIILLLLFVMIYRIIHTT